MDTRRGFFGSLLAVVGLGAFPEVASAKVISADPEGILVLTLPPAYDDPDDVPIQKLEKAVQDRYKGPTLIIPHGSTIKILVPGGSYHREKLGDYEIELMAPTEAELNTRLERSMTNPPPSSVTCVFDPNLFTQGK